ncbi:type II secretion system F family protein [Candidatus Bathyarchaeota archaeon]|nr:type II secretion system F family protein [Candidatus Bathyarchaeota archaeon]
MYFKRKLRIIVWAVSGLVGFLVILIPIVTGLYVLDGQYIIPLSQRVNNTIAIGFLIALGFPAVVEFNNYRWERQVDKNIPRLLRDITEAVRSGVTLPRALEEASQRNYGPISKELEHAISTFNFGASFEESVMSIARRLKQPSALRFSTILIEAHQTGGKLIDVLNASVDLFSSLEEYKEEQYTNMKPYMMTVYLTTLVFLTMAFVILHQFLGPLYAASVGTKTKDSGLLSGVLDINYYTSLLFWASIIESLFAGLVAGKIVDRTLSAGLRHSIILMIVTIAFFNFPGI